MTKIQQMWEDVECKLNKQEWRCAYCDFDFLSHPSAFGAMTLDHMISKKHGGEEGENLIPVCRLCNSLKGKRSFNSVEQAKIEMAKLREKYLLRWEYYDLNKKYRSN